MRWVQLEALTTNEASDAVCEAFLELGADGTAVEDPGEILALLARPDSLAYADEGFAGTLGEDVRVRAFFPEMDEGIRTAAGFRSVESLLSDAAERLADIGNHLPIGKGTVSFSFVADEDWANGWKKYYHPLRISPRILVCPSWETAAPEAGERVVSLDPGSAFGTGSHETTSLCAERLDALLPPGASVLDLGCGSGILAIIASRLGAGSVEAIDIDPLAVKVAKDNCAINRVAVDVHAGELKDARRPRYDFVVANIIADVIAALAADVPARLAPGGTFVASGIILEKSDRVLDACRAAGLALVESHRKGDWCAFVFRTLPTAP
jgi:ribosomal protein L11 methyltransferase